MIAFVEHLFTALQKWAPPPATIDEIVPGERALVGSAPLKYA